MKEKLCYKNDTFVLNDSADEIIKKKDERIIELERAIKGAVNIIKRKGNSYKTNSGRVAQLKKAGIRKDETIKGLVSNICSFNSLKNPQRTTSVDAIVSVVIPVLNSEATLGKLLGAIRRQKKINKIEIVAIDSGSIDSSVEIARKFGAKVVEISKESFSHGGTRQLALNYVSGEYILYACDDIMPVNDYWLFEIVATFEANPSLAVLSVKQNVNKDADLYSRWMNERDPALNGMVKNREYFLKLPSCFEYLPYPVKRKISLVDNVCACYRKDILMKYGFAPVPIAEDIEVGARMVKRGEHLGFLGSKGVLHWHSRGPEYFLKRHYNSVKPFVDFLGMPLPNLDILKINSIDDVGYRVAVACDLVNIVLDMWKTGEFITLKDVKFFIQKYSRIIRYDSDSNNARFSGRGVERAGLKVLFDTIGCKYASPPERFSKEIKHNHFVVSIISHIGNLFSFYLKYYHSIKVSKDEIADAIYKIIASQAGDILGAVGLKMSKNNKNVELEHLNRVMARGVCIR